MPGRSSRRGRSLLAPALLVVAAAAAVLAASAGAPAPREPAGIDTAAGLPPLVQPAFTPGPPRRLGSTRHLSHWAPVRRSVVARRAPRADARPVAVLEATTPEDTRNLTMVIARRIGGDRSWVKVALPILPSGTSGWVPRAALGGYQTVNTRLVVDLRRLRATLYRAGRTLMSTPVAVGRGGRETPRGRFYVRNRLTRYRSPEYGPVAFGTSARSPSATDWPAGGFVGIHGTDRPDLIPGRISHGCIRLRNEDILELARLMPVGTPLVVR